MAPTGIFDEKYFHHEVDTQGIQDKCSSTWLKSKIGIGNKRLTPRTSLLTLRETGIWDYTSRTVISEETRDNTILYRQNTLLVWSKTHIHNINHGPLGIVLTEEDSNSEQHNITTNTTTHQSTMQD